MVLHYHFAKFQLNSLSLRAITPDLPFSTDRKEAANLAIASAMATLNLVLEEPDVRDAVVGVPIFTHTMITFSAVFLLKVAVTWNGEYLSIDTRQVRHLVEQVIELMSCVSAGEKHLTRHIAQGLSRMLERFKAWDEATTTTTTTSPNNNSHINSGIIGSASTTTGASLAPSNNNMVISDMVGAYGFGLDENFLDPYMTTYGGFYT